MKVDLGDPIGSLSTELDGPKDPAFVLLMAHGAGVGIYHHFFEDLCALLHNGNGAILRFNFPYMESGRKSPGTPKNNIETISRMVGYAKQKFPGIPLFLSGKSYGGRMSSHLMAENPSLNVKGLIYFGFPLHAPGKDSKDRANHLYDLDVDQLFIQGTRDKLANIDLINEVVKDCKKAEIAILELGDHSFNVPKKLSGMSKEDVMSWIADTTKKWITRRI